MTLSTLFGRRFGFPLRAAILPLAGALAAAVPAAAPAQLFLTDPQYEHSPIAASDPLVGIPLPGATPAEHRAHLIWNMRAGLNVAALQCQFSPFLRSVPNYNAILAHHSKEFAEAYTTLTGYFRRVGGGARDGLRQFDDYSTATYNNFSTFHAQYGFCQTASALAKSALTQPKGSFLQFATQNMRRLRGSLVAAYDQIGVYNPYLITRLAPTVSAAPDCRQMRSRRERRQCEATWG